MKVEDIESRELIPGTEVRFVHSGRMTVAYWTFDPAVALPEHSHPHDQITNILEGEFELTIEGEPENPDGRRLPGHPAGRRPLRPLHHRLPDHRRVLAGTGGLPLTRSRIPDAGCRMPENRGTPAAYLASGIWHLVSGIGWVGGWVS
jgi:hypothetical protein